MYSVLFQSPIKLMALREFLGNRNVSNELIEEYGFQLALLTHARMNAYISYLFEEEYDPLGGGGKKRLVLVPGALYTFQAPFVGTADIGRCWLGN